MIEVFIECESGSNRKGVYDEKSHVRLSEMTVAAPYPYPYGFILDTRGDDGEAVDCFLLTDIAVEAGSTLEAHPVGLLEQVENGEVDHKILAALPGSEPALDRALNDRACCPVVECRADMEMAVGLLAGECEEQLPTLDLA